MEFRSVLAACGAMAVLAGCGNENGAGGSGGGGEEQAAPQTAPITLAVGVDPIFTPVFVAQAEQLFEKEGLEVDVQQYANAGEAADALLAGSADVAGVPDYNLLARASRADLTALGIFADDPGSYVKVVAAKDVSGPREMEKIGIVPGTYSEYAAAKLLESADVDPSKVEFVPTGPPELPPLLARGDIDGYVVWPPWTTRGEESGGKILYPTSEYGLSTVLTVATKDSWLQDHQQQADALMRALDAAGRQTEQDPAAAAQAAGTLAKLPEPLTTAAVGEIDFGVRSFTDEDRQGFQEIIDYLVERNVVEEEPSLDELLAEEGTPAA